MTIQEYLRDRNVKFREKGKNIGSGYLGVQYCPFCSISGFHGGINLKYPIYSCWACGKHSLTKFIRTIESCSWQKANKIVKQLYPDRIEEEEDKYVEKDESKFKQLLSQFSNKFSKVHKRYLEERGFDFDTLRNKYNLLCCNDYPLEFNYRIIAPVMINEKTVNFIGRDVTGRSTEKYLVCPDRFSLMPKKKLLYNLDSVTNKIIIVEGITDVWKLGNGSVATLSMDWTRDQVLELCELELKAAFVIYDNEPRAQLRAQKLCNTLSILCNIDHVERIELDGVKDPGELSEADIRYLRKELL